MHSLFCIHCGNLHSCLTLSRDESGVSAPRGLGPVAAEAAGRDRSRGLLVEHREESDRSFSYFGLLLLSCFNVGSGSHFVTSSGLIV